MAKGVPSLGLRCKTTRRSYGLEFRSETAHPGGMDLRSSWMLRYAHLRGHPQTWMHAVLLPGPSASGKKTREEQLAAAESGGKAAELTALCCIEFVHFRGI